MRHKLALVDHHCLFLLTLWLACTTHFDNQKSVVVIVTTTEQQGTAIKNMKKSPNVQTSQPGLSIYVNKAVEAQ